MAVVSCWDHHDACACACVCPLHLWTTTDIHEIWYEHHIKAAHSNAKFLNFLQSVIMSINTVTTWRWGRSDRGTTLWNCNYVW